MKQTRPFGRQDKPARLTSSGVSPDFELYRTDQHAVETENAEKALQILILIQRLDY